MIIDKIKILKEIDDLDKSYSHKKQTYKRTLKIILHAIRLYNIGFYDTDIIIKAEED